MFRKKRPESTLPEGARGYRAYVVGDIHGRLDLLDRLIESIHAEIERDRPQKVVLVFVGDLIDRGPDSAGVVERLRKYRHPGVRLVVLLGNHEEVLLRILEGDSSLVESWLEFGGAECLQSYGVDPFKIQAMEPRAALQLIVKAVPQSHTRFLSECADTFRFGDYLVVHAGIRPGIAVDQQLQSDMRWIREPFLGDDSDHGFVVVHGHTIRPEVEVRANRIGIDTGAYASGRLTALAIEGAERWFLDTAAATAPAYSDIGGS